MSKLKSEIKKLSQGTDEEIAEIYNNLTLEVFEKGEFLLKQNHICNQYFFIESGSVRLYYWKNEKDYTVWLGTEGQIFTELDSYLHQTPSLVSIESMEKSLVYRISKEKSNALAKKSLAYNTLLRRTVEEAFANMSRNIISFQSEDATERYLRVENEKNWLNKYPLKYISSFIGITQSSLSRLRAKRD
ncbi:Crp/Fnr family transcriptional regulator [Winogradskyella sp.]|uniref:Crp/Fnr family transcriptional regulator n=1 Tax=Winogradskyella sp. TaxID=1883156 RepID=UPI00261C6224|nr:cyclic nucleotide-binding domain-containing protein [Winogradskyella sp.]